MRGSWLLVWASGCVVGASDERFTFDDATSVTISLGSGDVTVETARGPDLGVAYEGGGVGRAAFPDVRQNADGAVIVDGGGLLGGGSVVVSLPAGLPLTALVDRGDVAIELSAGSDLEACVGAGSVSIGVPAGAYDLDLGAGVGSIAVGIEHDPDAAYEIFACAGAGSIDVYPIF